ncbi:helix-turn-helix domain-containing protein [Streptomyces sp. HC44]|uniref:Helix-turn-helix domain-containing protein n=1 Tax=Streptomyces scabichelini TaxID=2711217 RepID=A0A6G4VDI1_9ACTN|nr:helix-turn-helix domain-containing protein [Streptomyces scabichelini]
MARDRASLQGRDRELATLRAALATETGRLVVVRGPAGIGRSALLDAMGRILRSDGVHVLPVRFRAGADGRGDDAFGIAPMVRTVRDRFEHFDEVGLADSLSTVVRLSDAEGPEAGGWVPHMVAELGVLFDRIGRQERTAILVDDAHAVAEPAPLLASARRSGCLVLATCEETAEHSPGLAELLTAADQVITLGPLADDHAESLVRRAAGRRLDEAVPAALRTALGPLFTNPGTVLGTLADLRERGRLAVVRGWLCLRVPSEPIELPAGHHLLRRVACLGAPASRLLSSVAVWDGFGVDDLPLLAEALGADLADCGRALDQLIDAGVLVADPAGRVRCRCPALAASAAGRSGIASGVRLHASIAERLLARHRQGDGVDPGVLADHIARSGTALALDEDTVAWLLDLARAATREQPERTAPWCAAMLRRLPPRGPEYAEVLTCLLALVILSGQYELLREVLTRYAEQGCAPVSLAGIRLAACLVTLHTGRPPAEEAVRSLLDEEVPEAERIRFSEWWFGGRLAPADGTPVPHEPIRWSDVDQLISAEEIVLLRTALYGDPDDCVRGWRRAGRAVPSRELDRLCEAASMIDMATVAQIVLGRRYRVPETGVLGAYRRVVRGYAGGDWSQAMSAVREMELSASRDTLVHHPARLFAAEICAARGEFRQATQWLADAAPVPRLAALRTWVEIGLLNRMGEDRRAVRLARQTCRRLRLAGVRVELDLLLIRGVRIAAFVDDHEAAEALLEEIEHVHREGAMTHTRENVFMARALVNRDVAHAQAAADLARGRGDRPSLMESALVVARFAEDPRPWLREAHELAAQCGASALLERVRAVTRERGVPAPRARGQREAPADSERRIIELILDGLTNRQIALHLQVSEKTVEYYLTRLFARTGCRSRVELAAASLAGRLASARTS